MTLKYKSTQVKVDELRVLDFFDPRFIGLLEKNFPNISFQHFCIQLIDKTQKKTNETLSIGHKNIEDALNNIVVIDADYPETLEKILKIVEEFKKEKK